MGRPRLPAGGPRPIGTRFPAGAPRAQRPASGPRAANASRQAGQRGTHAHACPRRPAAGVRSVPVRAHARVTSAGPAFIRSAVAGTPTNARSWARQRGSHARARSPAVRTRPGRGSAVRTRSADAGCRGRQRGAYIWARVGTWSVRPPAFCPRSADAGCRGRQRGAYIWARVGTWSVRRPAFCPPSADAGCRGRQRGAYIWARVGTWSVRRPVACPPSADAGCRGRQRCAHLRSPGPVVGAR
jgi:hypothetical protein